MDRQPERESWRFPLDEKRKMESLGRIGRAAEKKQIRKYPSLAANIRSQLKFQSWKYWAVQGGILAVSYTHLDVYKRQMLYLHANPSR